MNWISNPSHIRWLHHKTASLLEFAWPTIRPEGGFYYPDADGRPTDIAPRLFLGARAVHAGAIGTALGIPGSGAYLDHALTSLSGYFWDTANGGWIEPGGERKMAYEHVQVGLGLASAMAVGATGATQLFERALALMETRWWDAEAGAFFESYAPDWTDLEDYRGANANMHGVEALLAIGDVTGDPIHHERALGIAQRIIGTQAAAHGWLIPEHYTSAWEPVLDYNQDEPNHPFRPFGATFGHSLEWARFLIGLYHSPHLGQPDWLIPAAIGLAERALDAGWGLDGRDGLVYTVDWDGQPVATARLHWPICEGIQATAALYRHTGAAKWADWYRRIWDHAARYFVEPRGTWINELDPNFVENPGIWPGRPDLYHAIGAYLVPTVGLTPFVTKALIAN